jgi:hypothetical protein
MISLEHIQKLDLKLTKVFQKSQKSMYCCSTKYHDFRLMDSPRYFHRFEQVPESGMNCGNFAVSP